MCWGLDAAAVVAGKQRRRKEDENSGVPTAADLVIRMGKVSP